MKPMCLIVMDGFGITKPGKGNAITLANPTNYNYYFANYPSTTLHASGEWVGLPKGQIGGSEVGHTTMGTGTVLVQTLEKINRAIKNGTFATNKVLIDFLNKINDLHIIGLTSDGGVHSHIDHLYELIKVANKYKKNIYIHFVSDGRDLPPQSAMTYVNDLEKFIKPFKNIKFASVMGRFYAMDRERNHDRTLAAYNCAANALANEDYPTVESCIKANYARGIFDEFVIPATINGGKVIEGGDGLMFFNFRSDRPEQFCNKLLKDKPAVFLGTFTNYFLDKPTDMLYAEDKAQNSLSKILSEKRLLQLKIAETTKFPHVTYFFNGGVNTKYKGEDQIEVASKPVTTFDLLPRMSTPQIVDILLKQIGKELYDFYIVNISNPDMVGHCGDLLATIDAIHVTDESIKKITDAILEKDGTVIITADHGNAEVQIDKGGIPHTAHTTNPVPFIIISKTIKGQLRTGGSLADVTPTILELLNIPQPKEITGKSLIK